MLVRHLGTLHRRRGFMLAGPDDASPDNDPECLIDFPEAGTVDWDALGFGCREPFYKSTLKARLKKTKTSKKQVARAA